MRFKKLITGVCCILGLGLTGLYAQEAIPTTGGVALGSGGSVCFTIGQIVYTTNIGTNGSVAQGVQQPFEISIVSGLETRKGINYECSVYPNPTSRYLILELEYKGNKNLYYQLYDMNGKILKTKELLENKNIITMDKFIPAIYFLNVFENNDVKRTFKIIKK